MSKLQLFADGACKANGSTNAVAGWGYVAVLDGEVIGQGSGRIEQGTNNIGELTAILKAMEWASIHNYYDYTIISDSAYCINGITEWVPNWKRNGWFRDANQTKEVKNLDLWKAIDKYNSKANITWEKIKGHAGHEYNELVDDMARRETQ